MYELAAQFLASMKDQARIMIRGSFNQEGIQKKIEATMGGRKSLMPFGPPSVRAATFIEKMRITHDACLFGVETEPSLVA